MSYRMERVEGISRVAYILYTEEMGYLATLSWMGDRLVYDLHHPDLVGTSARTFEATARDLDTNAYMVPK